MSDQAVVVERDANKRAVERCIESFAAALSRSGCCVAVIRQKRAMIERFAFWLGKRRIALHKIDEATVGAFLAYWRRRGFQIGNRRCTLVAFLEHLRQTGVTVRPEPVREMPDSTQLLLRRYQAYLREEQGLTAETADNYLRFVHPLVRERLHSADTDSAVCGLQAHHIGDFLLRSTGGLRPTTAQLTATALRSFLRYLFSAGRQHWTLPLPFHP